VKADAFLAHLRRSNILVEAAEGRLKVSAPKGAMSDALRDTIRTRKDELLAALLAEAAGPALVPVARDGMLPLSRFQRRLWIMCQLRGAEDAAYALSALWTITETRDPGLLDRAIRDLGRRHEILRTTFPEVGGEPAARILPADAVTVHHVALEEADAPDAQRRVQDLITTLLAAPFDLQREPVFRWHVIASPLGLGVVVATHHIAIDHWSFTILRRELAVSLAALARGEAAPVPDLQYVDYAAWRARIEQEAALQAHLDWWAARLANPPDLSIFPPDRQSTDQQAWRVANFSWDERLASGLGQVAREQRVTLYMVLVALCVTALRRLTGQKDLIIGSSTGSRERVELETMVGPFVNVLALRFDLADDPSFEALLQRARNTVLDSHAHADAPFEMIVERVNPARSFDHTPLFQVAVILHNGEGAQDSAAIEGGGSMYDMTWYAREQHGQLEMSLEYRSDLYSDRAIERVLTSLKALAHSAVADRSQPVSRLPLAAPAEVARAMAALNPTPTPLSEPPFPAAFARQAAATPERIALRHAGRSMRYGDLDAMVNRVARLLMAQGVEPGRRVGLCCDRSPLLVAAMIAIQKLGAAYVPLDPAYPHQRLAFMADDCDLFGVVTDPAQASVAASLGRPTIVLDDDVLAAQDAGAVPSRAEPGGTAYVIYTSGSTGRPNGVVIPHAALSNFLASMLREPGITESDVVAAITTISFDIAALELLAPLLAGATVEIVAREVATDGEALAHLLDSCGASLLQATPATWRLLIGAGWQGRPGLRALCGGEALPRDLADALLARVAEVWNLYGPTEATVWATVGRVRADAPIHIGRPILNTQIYVVDQHGALLSPGIAGELVIGGDGLAQGYHDRPELTASRFIADRFDPTPGARLYRTGDLGMWSDDGVLRHLGRLDHQVKIRGFRIELGEIETALARHPAVREAVVIAESRGGSARLLAYYVPRSGSGVTTSELRNHLRATLPDHAIPSLFAPLDAVPLTPNGKVDRRALSLLGGSSVATRTDAVACNPGLETALSEIWKDVLEVDRVSPHDNFFEIGGHSLLSLRVTVATYDRTGHRMAPRLLFTHNLRNICEHLEQSKADKEVRN
jgi:amino acid adenylation domain-containing protein